MARVLTRHHTQREANTRMIRCKCLEHFSWHRRTRRRHRTRQCPACKCSPRQNNRNNSRRPPASKRCRECRCRKTLNQNSCRQNRVQFTHWSNCSSQPLNTIPPSNRPKQRFAQPKAENVRQGCTPILRSGIWGSRLLAALNVVVNRGDSFSRTSFWAANLEQLDVFLSRIAGRPKQNAKNNYCAFR